MTVATIESLRAVAGPVSRETFERLLAFEQLFRKWNQRINLVASSTEGEIWRRHVLDSAQLMSIAPDATNWLDLGSGGGFPGLVVAFLLQGRRGFIRLVESNRKKASFLQTTTGQFSLPAQVFAQRIHDCYQLVPQPEIVTARAVAPLVALLDIAAPWLTNGATGLFHKGRDYRQEMAESAHHWAFDLIEHPSLVDPEGVVLEFRNVRSVSKKPD